MDEIKRLPIDKNLTPESLKVAMEVFRSEMPRIMNDPEYNQVYQLELEYYRKDGTTIWLENKFSIIRSLKDRSISFLGEGRDITDRKLTEDALKRSHSLLEATFESIHNGILVVSSEGKVIKTNATFAKMWNVPNDLLATAEDNILLNYVLDQLADPGEFISKVRELYENPESETFDQIYFKDERIFERISKPMYIDGLPKGRVWSFLDITAQKLADEALREERWRLAKIVEATRAGTWEWNVQTGDAVFNERWAQMLGYTLDELAPVSIRTWQNLVHPDDLEKSNKLLEQHYTGELTSYSCECRMKHKDGHWIWIHDRGTVMTRTSDGKPMMMFGTHTDISDRKMAEEQLMISQRNFNQLVGQLTDLIWQAKGDGSDLMDLNDSFERIYGIPSNEFNLKPELWIDVVHPEDRKYAEKSIQDLFEKGNTETEYRVLRPDGSIIWLHDRKSMIYDLNGNPIQMGGVATDITERKLLEEKLLIKDFALENSPVAVGLADLKGNVFYTNDAFIKQWGYKDKSDIYGKHISEFSISKDIVNLSFSKMKQGLSFHGEGRLKRQDGSTFESLISARMVNTKDGKPLCIMALFVDITDLKIKEAEIVEKNDQLIQANSEKDKFFSIIAHDLRSPFNSFLGFTQLLVEDLDSMTLKDIQQIAELMRNSATNLFKLLENLLEWSRIRRGVTSFAPEQYILKSIMDESLQAVVEAGNKKGVVIKQEISEIIRVYADEYMIKSTIRNLATNALKFTNKGGSVVISASLLADNYVEVSIKDSGIGMNKSILDNLFRLDEQTNRKGTEGEPSSGLGLIICKEFIEKNGGKLRIESEENIGSIFYFTVPAESQSLIN
jgi:PAS domain S-box-containing protein